MTGPNHDRLVDLSGLYVLDALGPEDREAFEAHVRECAECAAEVRSFHPVVEGLARTVPSREPPAKLRQRVMESVQPGSPPQVQRATPMRQPASAWPAWLLAAACLLAAIGLGWQTLRLQSAVRTLEARLEEATLRENFAQREIADARTAAAEAQSTVAVLAAPDLARIDLAGQPPAAQASARAFWSRSRGLVFTALRLPAVPAGKTYQLWVVTASMPISAGLLRPDPTGSVTTVVATSPDIPQPIAMAVTVEPEGGVPAPTGDKYLIGTVGN